MTLPPAISTSVVAAISTLTMISVAALVPARLALPWLRVVANHDSCVGSRMASWRRHVGAGALPRFLLAATVTSWRVFLMTVSATVSLISGGA